MPEAPAETSRLLMGCNGHTFGCRLADDWSETYYVGFTACEGRNRFAEFPVMLIKNGKVKLNFNPFLYKI